MFSPDKDKGDDNELQELKKSAREEIFQFVSPIIQNVIVFELSLKNGTPSTEKELKITEIIHSQREGGAAPRLGLMRLSSLELLDKLQLCYGLRMLEVFKEADLFTVLLKMYALYPYNDIGLRYVTSIISYALDHTLAQAITQRQEPPKRPSRILDLEPIQAADDTTDTTA